MTTITINLENEHVLAGTLQGLIESLSTEQVTEIAKAALEKYLTDTVDYARGVYKQQLIEEIRLNGFRHPSYSSYNKTVEQVSELSDLQISHLDGFAKRMESYKSPKESQFDKINKILDEELKKVTETYVQENQELKKIVESHQEQLNKNFPEIVKQVLQTIGYNLLMDSIQKAQFSASMSNIWDITQRLDANGIPRPNGGY